jgi:serine/threonine-protein kinase
MSYEQIRCMSDVDHRTDIYAFGVLLYQAITGALPYDGDTLPGIIMQAATGRAVRPIALCPDLPPELDELVMKAIALRREDRYQSMDAMINALTRIQLARHSWSSSTERPSWAPGSLPVAAPVMRARERFFSGRSAQSAHRALPRSVEPHAATAKLRSPIEGGASTPGSSSWLGGAGGRFYLSAFARRNFAPINPWLGLTGAALGIVMGGALYTHVMTPTPSHAGKASASAPTQPESPPHAVAPASASTASGARWPLVVDGPRVPLLPELLPSGKEPPFSLAAISGPGVDSVRAAPGGAVNAGAANESSQQTSPEATGTSGAKTVKPASALASNVSLTARASEGGLRPGQVVRPEPGSAAQGNKSAPASVTKPVESQPVAPAVASPVAHTHRSGPLKLEDL